MDGVKVSGKFWLRRDDYVHPLVWVLPIQVCVHTGKDSEDCSLEVPHPNCDWSMDLC